MEIINLKSIKNAKPFTIVCTLNGAICIQNLYSLPLDTLILVRSTTNPTNKIDCDSYYLILDENEENFDEIIENNKNIINNEIILNTSKYEIMFYKKVLNF